MKSNSISLLAVLFLIAACGDNNGTSNTQAGAAAGTPPTEASAPEVPAEEIPGDPTPTPPVLASRCTSTSTSAVANLYFDGHLYTKSAVGSVMTEAYLRLKNLGACEGGQNTRCSIMGGETQTRIVIDGIATAPFPLEGVRNSTFEKLIESGFCKQGVAPRCSLQPGNVLAVDGVGAHYDSPYELINQLRALKANGTCN